MQGHREETGAGFSAPLSLAALSPLFPPTHEVVIEVEIERHERCEERRDKECSLPVPSRDKLEGGHSDEQEDRLVVPLPLEERSRVHSQQCRRSRGSAQ